MQVEVCEGDVLLGSAYLEHLDPPMGVAYGPFSPTSDYKLLAHANLVEGEYVGDKGLALAVTAGVHGPLDASIAIEDWSDPEFGQQLTLFFRNGENFAALFAKHPDFRAYYPHYNNGN